MWKFRFIYSMSTIFTDFMLFATLVKVPVQTKKINLINPYETGKHFPFQYYQSYCINRYGQSKEVPSAHTNKGTAEQSLSSLVWRSDPGQVVHVILH